MLNDHAKLVYAINNAGEIVGRKKLQKIIYIAKKVNFPFHEKFNFHFYGPYSEELSLRVEELVNLGLVSELKEDKGNYIQYRYTLTDEGSDFLKMNDVQMDNFEKCIQLMNEQNARFLELVSTVLYFDTLERAEVEEKIATLKSKQSYTVDEITEAYKFINLLSEKALHN